MIFRVQLCFIFMPSIVDLDEFCCPCYATKKKTTWQVISGPRKSALKNKWNSSDKMPQTNRLVKNKNNF